MTTFLRRTSNPGGLLTKPQALHVHKAITDKDMPPKVKHVRAIILATFDEHSSNFFYTLTSERPLSSNPVVCWKFLYIIYKLLRAGHPECIRDGIRNASKLWQLQAAWSASSITSGYPLASFFRLLIGRLKLHRKYSILPGNLELTMRDRTTTLQALPDHLFQFSVDLMDFLEEILRFHDAVLSVVDVENGVICNPSAQCKITPFLLCLQDAGAVYELVVYLLFKLHELLGKNAMTGHRERFACLHNQLVAFFQRASRIQYFRALVQIPTLTQNPPNFCIESELDRHTSFRVSVTESNSSEDEAELNALESTVDVSYAVTPPHSSSPTHTLSTEKSSNNNAQLVDVADQPRHVPTPDLKSTSSLTTHNGTNTQYNLEQSAVEPHRNNHHFEHHGQMQLTDESHEFLLETELLKSEVGQLKAEHEQVVSSLVDRIKTLESEIQEVVQQKSLQDEHCDKLETKARLNAHRATTAEEKFTKLKQVYSKLREEHVSLLRDLSTTQAMVEESEKTNADMRKQITALETQLTELKSQQPERLEHADENGYTALDTSVHPMIPTEELIKPALNMLDAYIDDAQTMAPNMNGGSAVSQFQDHLFSLACSRNVDRFRQLYENLNENELVEEWKIPTELYRLTMDATCSQIQRFRAVLNEDSSTDPSEFLLSVCDLASQLYVTLLQQKIVSAQTDMQDYQQLMRQLATEIVQLFEVLATDRAAASKHASTIAQSLEQLNSSFNQLQTTRRVSQLAEETEWLSALDKEMFETVKFISAAEEKYKQLAASSFSSLSSAPLRVHQLILDRCSALIAAIRELVLKSKVAQRSISDTNLNTQNYKRQSRWNQGILSAAKSVGACANVLVEVSDQLVSGREHVLERLLVVAQEVSASTAQLFVASRVKLPPDSPQLTDLQTAVRTVSQTTGDLVGSVKSAIETHEATELDFSGLTLTQAKRMQVESQVRVLKLEKALEDERYQLSQLRKHNYRDEAEVEDQAVS